jgi:hypothetical protein
LKRRYPVPRLLRRACEGDQTLPKGVVPLAMSAHTSTDPSDSTQDLEVLDLKERPVRERRCGVPPTRIVRFWMLIFAGVVVAMNQVGSWVGVVSGNALAVKLGVAVTPWAWFFLIMSGASYVAPARLGHVVRALASRVLPTGSTPPRPAHSNVRPGPQ